MTFLCRVRVPCDARNEAINTDIFCSALGGAERPGPPPPSPAPLSLAGPPGPRGPGVPKAPSAWTSTPTPPFLGRTVGASTSLPWQRPQVLPRAKTLFRLSGEGAGMSLAFPLSSCPFWDGQGRQGEGPAPTVAVLGSSPLGHSSCSSPRRGRSSWAARPGQGLRRAFGGEPRPGVGGGERPCATWQGGPLANWPGCRVWRFHPASRTLMSAVHWVCLCAGPGAVCVCGGGSVTKMGVFQKP